MAPIDLPPEPSLRQLPAVSISTVLPKTKQTPGAQHLLAEFSSTPSPSTDSTSVTSSSPQSLLPAEQWSAPSTDDFSKPNLAQLPSLPPQAAPEPETFESFEFNQLDSDIQEAVEPAIERLETEPAAIDLDDIEPNRTESETVEDANLDDLAPDILDSDRVPEDLIPGTLDSDRIPGGLEDIDVSPSGSDEPVPAVGSDLPDSDPPGSAIDPATPTAAPPLDPSKLEITADTQIFDADRQVVIARGNVVFKLNNAFLLADELWVNLVNRYVLAEGNVILTRGEQEVRGERAEYNLLQEEGTLFETRGELFLPDLEDDFASPTDATVTSRTVFDPLNPDRDVTNVRNTGGFEVSSEINDNAPGDLPDTQGGVRRLRFEAARVYFDAETWVAEEVRLTNDPFSPPELEYRTNRMTLVALSPTADLLTTANPRLVFDQGLSLPLFKSRYILNRGATDSNQIDPFFFNIGSDSRDRGGIFLEREISLFRNESTSFSITPQYYIERATNQGVTDQDVFGIEADFNTRLSRRSELTARASLTSFDFDDVDDNLRGYIRNRNLIGRHRLTAEYSYRDRFFNGSLGFQDVRSSLGLVLQSPAINLDGRGLIWTYQVGGQLITSDTDRVDLLGRPRTRIDEEDLITLGRMQASTRLSKRFNLWRGQPLPATKTEGLRYSPVPLVPSLSFRVNLLGVASYYTSGDLPTELSGDIRLDGQVGHLSRNFFDYTRFNLGYSEDIISDDRSPFLFDRDVDRRVLSFGVLQQIFGPILLGFQTSININTQERINTDFIFQYSRRTYGFVLRYSPTRETGSIGFRLNDFNWLGNGSPFDEPNIRQVDNGLVEPR